MICSKCGKEIANDSNFCEYCGVKVEYTFSDQKVAPKSGGMSFSQALSVCFSKYATFKGRASRPEFWWFALFNFLLVMLAELADASMVTTPLLTLFVYLFLFTPGLSVSIRRCHDSDHSGWWILCPVYNIILMFLPSTEERNEYN